MADTHNIRINPSTAKRAKTQTAAEYESFPPGRPSVVSEETWQLVQEGVALGAPCASKKQKVDCVYINLDSQADRRESRSRRSCPERVRRPPRLASTRLLCTHKPLPFFVQASRQSGCRR